MKIAKICSMNLIILLFSILFFSGCTIQDLPMPVSPFNRGINIANALEAPHEGDWGVVIEDWFFQEIKSRGFDCVRIPLGWAFHIIDEADAVIDPVFFNRVEHVINQAILNDLKVIISFHSFEEFYTNPVENEQEFGRIWERITSRFFALYPDKLFFELLNEPHDNLTVPLWNRIQLETIEKIRRLDEERWIILTGADWGKSNSLAGIDLPKNRYKLLATFHMYEPYLFTHQGVPWLGDAYSTIGVSWPGPPSEYLEPSEKSLNYPETVKWFNDYNLYPYEFNPAGPLPIKNAMNMAMQWSKTSTIPIFMGEFGTYKFIDDDSRVNWTAFVNNVSEEMGIGWLYWDFSGNFGIFDEQTHTWNHRLLDALGLGSLN